MRGFRKPKAKPINAFGGVLPCEFCDEPILYGDETYFALGRYDAKLFRWTKHAHARCIAALVDQDLGEDQPKEA